MLSALWEAMYSHDCRYLTPCMLGNFHAFGAFRKAIRVSNGLDPDQDRRSVGPDLGPNCMQRLSADN